MVVLPETFSFIDDPEATLRALRTFVAGVRDNPSLVRVDQAACTQIDLCAASVLNELAVEASRKLKVGLQGRFPLQSEETREIVVATGLPARLGLTKPHSHFLLFPVQRGGRTTAFNRRTATKGRASTLLADYLENCFARVGYQLKREAKTRLGDLTGEVLGNVEDHVPEHDWYMQAYMRLPGDRPYGDCHIAIFNFGPTIAETLQSMSDPGLRSAITDLVQTHRRRNFFQIQPGWTEEGLWTLYALQEGVTRLSGQPGQHHGIGTADMIEAFQELGGTLGGEQPKMCVLSGHTHITFDSTYPIRLEPHVDGVDRRTIAFNRSNQLDEPPDPKAVRHLDNYFPGTLISLRFFMHEPFLLRVNSK